MRRSETSTHPPDVSTVACDWCGRAIRHVPGTGWWAVKGEERGYDPLICDAANRAYESLERVFAEGNRTLDIDRIRRGEGFAPNWFRCADGTVLSVVAGGGTWCSPRDGEGPFSAVEVWYPGEPDPTAQVPVEDVRSFVALHGGAVAVARNEDEARSCPSDESSAS